MMNIASLKRAFSVITWFRILKEDWIHLHYVPLGQTSSLPRKESKQCPRPSASENEFQSSFDVVVHHSRKRPLYFRKILYHCVRVWTIWINHMWRGASKWMKRSSFNLPKQVLNPYVFIVWLAVSHDFPAEQSQSPDVTLSEVDAWPVDLELTRQLRRIITIPKLDIELFVEKLFYISVPLYICSPPFWSEHNTSEDPKSASFTTIEGLTIGRSIASASPGTTRILSNFKSPWATPARCSSSNPALTSLQSWSLCRPQNSDRFWRRYCRRVP